LASKSATYLCESLPVIVVIVHETMAQFGLHTNWGPQKSEAMLTLRGSGSTELYAQIWKQEIPSIPVVGIHDINFIRVVMSYKYLGSILSEKLARNADAIRRTRLAMASYAPIATKVFGSSCISTTLKVALAFSLVFSRLLYGVQTWQSVTKWCYEKLNGTYMRVLRRIAGLHFEKGKKCISNTEVRRTLCIPSLECLIMQRRLLHFGKYGQQIVCLFRPCFSLSISKASLLPLGCVQCPKI
jgi:hypothetical protein